MSTTTRHVAVDGDIVEGVVQLADQLGGHRVELVGAVQGDEPHALTRRRDEHGIHGRERSPGCRGHAPEVRPRESGRT